MSELNNLISTKKSKAAELQQLSLSRKDIQEVQLPQNAQNIHVNENLLDKVTSNLKNSDIVLRDIEKQIDANSQSNENESFEIDLDELKNQYEQEKFRNESLKTEQENLNHEAVFLGNKKLTLEGEVNVLQETEEKLTAEISDLDKEIETTKEEVKKGIDAKCSAIKQEINNMKADLKDYVDKQGGFAKLADKLPLNGGDTKNGLNQALVDFEKEISNIESLQENDPAAAEAKSLELLNKVSTMASRVELYKTANTYAEGHVQTAVSLAANTGVAVLTGGASIPVQMGAAALTDMGLNTFDKAMKKDGLTNEDIGEIYLSGAGSAAIAGAMGQIVKSSDKAFNRAIAQQTKKVTNFKNDLKQLIKEGDKKISNAAVKRQAAEKAGQKSNIKAAIKNENRVRTEVQTRIDNVQSKLNDAENTLVNMEIEAKKATEGLASNILQSQLEIDASKKIFE